MQKHIFPPDNQLLQLVVTIQNTDESYNPAK